MEGAMIGGVQEGWGERGDLIRHGFTVPPFLGTAVPVSLKTALCAVFQALDAPEGEGFWGCGRRNRVCGYYERHEWRPCGE